MAKPKSTKINKYHEFGQLLTKERMKHGFSQLEVANKLNVSRTNYSCWEIGRGRPRVDDLRKLIEFFRVGYEDRNRWVILADYNIANNSKGKDAIFFSKEQRGEISKLIARMLAPMLTQDFPSTYIPHVIKEIEEIINLPRIKVSEFEDYTEAEIEFNKQSHCYRIPVTEFAGEPLKEYAKNYVAHELLRYVSQLNDEIEGRR